MSAVCPPPPYSAVRPSGHKRTVTLGHEMVNGLDELAGPWSRGVTGKFIGKFVNDQLTLVTFVAPLC